MSTRLPLAGLLIAALLVVSCQKTSRQPAAASAPPSALPDTALDRPALPPGAGLPPPPGPPPKPAAAAAPVPSANPLPPPKAGATPGAGGIALQPPPGAAPPQKGLSSAATLMALGRAAPILPEDFKIGPLGDDRGEQQDQNRAMDAADRFLADLVDGTVNKTLIAADSRDAVSEAMSFGIEHGNTPTSFRVGRPRTRDDGEVTAAVRLFGHESSSEGEIYVSRSGSEWLVADLQLNLAQLLVRQEKPKEKFFPLEYRWLLEE